MKFSLLMSIYSKDDPEHFNATMESIWDNQTIKANEIVLVQDGSVDNKLAKVIDNWQAKLGDILKFIQLKENIGAGGAKNIGLEKCSFELIAIMDTDDISLPKRFEKQLSIFEKSDIDVCGSWVGEFENNEKKIITYKKTPEHHDEIVAFAKTRNPMNHPTIMYKKSLVQKAKGYQKLLYFEDYYLWVVMMIKGAKFYNIQEPLVNMRIGNGQIERRSGFSYAIKDVALQNSFFRLGFINIFQYIKNIAIRFFIRILPKKIIKKIYRFLRNYF